MKSISFVSNTITNSFNKYFKNDFSISHYDLDTIYQVLHSGDSSDYLVVLFDHRFLFDTYIDDVSAKLSFLEDSLVQFRQKSSTKVFLSNVCYSFVDFHSTTNIEEYKKLIDINMRLEMIANNISDVAIINVFNIAMQVGIDNLISKNNMYLFQTPFTKFGIEKISQEILKKINIFEAKRAKILAIDADNTLWGGIIGEDGIDGIKIDNNYAGIIYQQFQKQLLMLKNSGIVLCMVSKNNQQDVLEVFEKKQMPLSKDDFVMTKINWSPKSENIKEIAKSINVGVDAIVFVDDSDYEIAEVSGAIGIECIKIDKDNLLDNLSILEKVVSLNTLHITQEDKEKSDMYKAEETRKEMKNIYQDMSEYIKSLDIKIEYNINKIENLSRITQLINKTNQFNLTTKRYSQSQVEEMMQKHKVYDFRVVDKFGDMGLVAVVILKSGIIDTFLMSCRVLGREIEKKILHTITKDIPNIKAMYIKSDKNMQVENFYENNGFVLVSSDDTTKEYVLAQDIKDIEYITII